MKANIKFRIMEALDALLCALSDILHKVYSFCNGRFGRKVLRQPYRRIWASIWFVLFIWAFLSWVCVPFFEWWDGIVRFLNHVIWG